MINQEINLTNYFGDTRLGKRVNSFLSLITKHQKVSINSISKDWAETVGNYRMLENEKVTCENITAGIIDNCSKVAQCSHALIFQDTTQPSYEKNSLRIKVGSGLGEIGDNKSLGYFLHPSLVVMQLKRPVWVFQISIFGCGKKDVKNIQIRKSSNFYQ